MGAIGTVVFILWLLDWYYWLFSHAVFVISHLHLGHAELHEWAGHADLRDWYSPSSLMHQCDVHSCITLYSTSWKALDFGTCRSLNIGLHCACKLLSRLQCVHLTVCTRTSIVIKPRKFCKPHGWRLHMCYTHIIKQSLHRLHSKQWLPQLLDAKSCFQKCTDL